MPRRARQIDPDVYEAAAKQLIAEFEADYPEHRDEVMAFLRAAAGDPKAIEDKVRYRFPPVGPREFMESPSYMNAPTGLWPKVMDEFVELNSGQYVESVITGGIGAGKTHIALNTQAYQLYRISCLRDPHKEFDLDPSSEIMVIFQSLNEALATSVDYARFRSMLSRAPYFKNNFPFDRSYLSEMRFPNRIVVKPVSGQETGAIGQNVIGGIIDEVDFMAIVENSKVNRDGSVYDQAAQNYQSIARRRESRFMQLGALPGMLCLVSSKNYPGGMTDRKVAEARSNKRIFVYDKRIWDVRPERFRGEFFRVFVGDETRKPRLLDEQDIVELHDEALITAVPEEYRAQFENDLIKSIRDIAGVSTQTIHPFMLNTDAVAACFGTMQSIASREDIDFKATRLEIYPKRIINPREPRFAHIDLSISHDSAGLVIGHVPGFKHMNRGEYQETLPIIALDLVLEIKPPRGGEIEFEQIRQLLYSLRDKIGLPIKWVSFDQFQSTDSQQILTKNGFIVGYQSMDKDTGPYDLLKQAFYDARILSPHHARAQKEVTALEFDAKHQKVDHQPQGSKDVSDAMAGVAFGLTMRREIWVRHAIPLTRVPASLDKINHKNSVTAKERAERFEAQTKQPRGKGESHMDFVRRQRGVAPTDGEDFD
jgi:hypothetical protein